MKRLKQILAYGPSAIGALTKLIELSSTPALVQNPKVKEVVGHLLWLGNVCWYIGIPLTVIYILVKLYEMEKVINEQLPMKIESLDKWTTKEVRRHDDELAKCIKQQ